jgi:hypothetical protein
MGIVFGPPLVQRLQHPLAFSASERGFAFQREAGLLSVCEGRLSRRCGGHLVALSFNR